MLLLVLVGGCEAFSLPSATRVVKHASRNSASLTLSESWEFKHGTGPDLAYPMPLGGTGNPYEAVGDDQMAGLAPPSAMNEFRHGVGRKYPVPLGGTGNPYEAVGDDQMAGLAPPTMADEFRHGVGRKYPVPLGGL